MTADDLRPCRACGQPCDGDVCDGICAAELYASITDIDDSDSDDDNESEDE